MAVTTLPSHLDFPLAYSSQYGRNPRFAYLVFPTERRARRFLSECVLLDDWRLLNPRVIKVTDLGHFEEYKLEIFREDFRCDG